MHRTGLSRRSDPLKQIDSIYYSLSDRRGGRAPDELNASLALRLGMLVGRMHNVAVADPSSNRRPINGEYFIRRPLAWLEEHRSIPQALEARYHRAAEGIAECADRLLVEVDTHRIHGDLHLGNVLLRDDQFNILDFDDMAPGPAVQDLWLALPGRDEETLRLREGFLSGYEQFRVFDRSSLRLIEALRGLRLVRYAVWLARRWHDPAFRIGWPHFGTFEYWDGETRDLEDQLEVVKKESESRESRLWLQVSRVAVRRRSFSATRTTSSIGRTIREEVLPYERTEVAALLFLIAFSAFSFLPVWRRIEIGGIAVFGWLMIALMLISPVLTLFVFIQGQRKD